MPPFLSTTGCRKKVRFRLSLIGNHTVQAVTNLQTLHLFPQICRVKITFELLLNNWFDSTKTNSMKCYVNWIRMFVQQKSHFDL